MDVRGSSLLAKHAVQDVHAWLFTLQIPCNTIKGKVTATPDDGEQRRSYENGQHAGGADDNERQ